MDALECIKSRRSIRRFKPEPVPKDILINVVETAMRSPSYKNSQPWEVIIVSGRKKEALSELLLNLFEKGKMPRPDLPEPKSWPYEIEKRIKEHLTKRSSFLGIDITSQESQIKAKRANFRFYGAPHGVFLYQDKSLTAWSILDMGMFAQSLMLAAHAHGLGTVPQAFLTDYAPEIKNFLGIPESKRLILGISIGYPDLEDRVNSYRSDRIEIKEVLKWIED